MNDVLCGRVGCGEPAVAVLLMSPQDTSAWIVAPDHESAPEGVPLCAAHADRISVPFGWSLSDNRPAPKKKRRRKKAGAETIAEPQLVPDESSVEPEPTPSDPASDSSPALTSDDADEPASTRDEPSGTPAVEHRAAPGSDDAQAAPATQSAPAEAASEPVEPVEESDSQASRTDPEPGRGEPIAELEREPFTEGDPGYVAPEYQFREDGELPPGLDEPTMEMAAIGAGAPATPAEVPLDADRVAASVDESAPRLSVVPGDDDPNKTYDFSDEGQGALWNEPEPVEAEPDEKTPLLQRAFRVVRDD